MYCLYLVLFCFICGCRVPEVRFDSFCLLRYGDSKKSLWCLILRWFDIAMASRRFNTARKVFDFYEAGNWHLSIINTWSYLVSFVDAGKSDQESILLRSQSGRNGNIFKVSSPLRRCFTKALRFGLRGKWITDRFSRLELSQNQVIRHQILEWTDNFAYFRICPI